MARDRALRCRRAIGDGAYTSSPAGLAGGVVGVIPIRGAQDEADDALPQTI
jgi:hypothetical protein